EKFDLHETKGVAPRQTDKRGDKVYCHDFFRQPAFGQPSFVGVEGLCYIGDDFTKGEAKPDRRAYRFADILDVEGQVAGTMPPKVDDEGVTLLLQQSGCDSVCISSFLNPPA